MKILFKNNTEITKEKIIKFNYYNLYRNKFLMFILLYMPAIWIISGVGMFVKESDSRRLVTSFVLSIAWLALIFLPPYLSVKRKYKVEDYCNEYEFYEDKFVAKNKFASEEIFYVNLYKIYDTKKYLYFYINKKSALIVEKDKFKKGTDESFSDFIREKVNKRYKKSML